MPFRVIEKLPPCPCLGLFDLGLFDEPGLDLLPQAIGVAIDADGGRVVQDHVQDGRGDHRVAEDLVPLGEAAVRGQDQGTLFVTPLFRNQFIRKGDD